MTKFGRCKKSSKKVTMKIMASLCDASCAWQESVRPQAKTWQGTPVPSDSICHGTAALVFITYATGQGSLGVGCGYCGMQPVCTLNTSGSIIAWCEGQPQCPTVVDSFTGNRSQKKKCQNWPSIQLWKIVKIL